MIIDCHGHYTTAPKQLEEWRKRQIAELEDSKRVRSKGSLGISDDEIRASLEGAQLKLQRERGTDITIFSPRAMGMSHHIGNETTSRHWSEHCNELIHRVCTLYPEKFVGVCQLPQSPGVPPANCIPELERCVKEFGFIGCNLNPDPSGGYWNEPPLTDKWWYPLYEKMVELEVPAMVHVSASCNPNFHGTGAHYINGDTTAFMQFITADLFKDFPTLKFVIPHGGGAVPYHWGRYRGLAQDMKRPPLKELLMNNVFFDTCVYHQPGIDLLLKVIPADNILFASEMVGAVKGVDPETGFNYDDTKRYIDAAKGLSKEAKEKIFHGNAMASALILFAIAMPFLYAARKLVHDLFRSIGHMIGGPLRLGARWLFATARDMQERNKAVLLAHGKEEVGQHIEREFERVGLLVTRDLEGYPALQRKVLDEITRVEEDYKKCGEVPPPPPDWVEAVAGIAKIKSEHSEMVKRILEEIKRSVDSIHGKALEEYRRAYQSRHKILNGFMPFWRSLDKTLGQVDKKLTGLQDTSSKLDAQMEKYEQINKKTDKAEHALTVSAFTQFAVATVVLLVAMGGALVNFNMIV